MILEFSVENYKSFKNLQILSLQASETKNSNNLSNTNTTYLQSNDIEVLKSKAIFGGNGSGKSNLINAIATFWKIIKNNLSEANEIPILTQRILSFKLDEKSVNQPSFFQIVFVKNEVQYRYGFEADFQEIHSEWLYVKKKSERKYFIRDGQEIIYAKPEIKGLLKKNNKLYKSNTLVLSVLNALNNEVATEAVEGILADLSVHTGHHSTSRKFWKKHSINSFIENKNFRLFVTDLFKSIDDTITGFDILQDKDFHITRCVTKRKNIAGKEVIFDLENEEGEGSNKLFSLAYIIYDSLINGKTFVIDEFDARLHPLLTRKIISLFHSELAHPNAQFIFVSHDSNLLDNGFLSRDQITFVDKLKNGASEIFDLSDIKGVRATDLFEKNYLSGKYGGLPFLGNLEKTLINA